ncbi:MAG: pyrroloquinoline quinone-dependent dehydrogenase [Steroidobacteraceae bacterium]
MKIEAPGRARRLFRWLCVVLLLAMGVVLAGGGWKLARLGGSWYYLLLGLGLVASAVLLARGRAAGAALYARLLWLSILWAAWEAGPDAWALAPRLGVLLLVGLLLRGAFGARHTAGRSVAGAVVALLIGLGAHAIGPRAAPDPQLRAGRVAAPATAATLFRGAADGGADWRHVGGDAGGARYSALADLTTGNVRRLRLAWSYRTGQPDMPLEVTPIKVDDTLYLCTGANDVIALDAESGIERWRFRAGAEGAPSVSKVCRGVAYYRVPDREGACAARIITNTVDARLIALDARDGRPCEDFGEHGVTSLLTGMGDAQGRVIPGYYFVTSAPTIVRGRIVLGGWVSDAQYWGEPSGVIRAYDAVNGRFAWAFDMGRPDEHGEPAPGSQYTPSTPNSWAPMAADEELGLVYAPTGNTTGSDYYGVLRRPFDERYSSSVVALDAESGAVRWSFQTVHHDLWDYDLAAQPVLVDLQRAEGVRRALIQGTKTGEIFVLDRATGEPLWPVRERAVPVRGALPEERVSPTQPESGALPAFGGPPLSERAMWGVSPFDQLWCRIRYREARDDGAFTPPGPTASIQNPGILGGIEWGSVSIDAGRGLMFVNASRVANYVRLMGRAEADALGRKPQGLGGRYGDRAMFGTPYSVANPPFLSPLGVPCQQPPFGTLAAVDLGSGRLVWSRRLGTARDSGPFGWPSLLPLPLGTPNTGGSVATRGGLVFIAASQDRMLRAFAAASGELLWQARLPAGAQASPMTYRSARSGRQFVVIAAGGSDTLGTQPGDYILAYALPRD